MHCIRVRQIPWHMQWILRLELRRSLNFFHHYVIAQNAKKKAIVARRSFDQYCSRGFILRHWPQFLAKFAL